MSNYRTPNRQLQMKIETTRGTDAVPTPAADAILCEGPVAAPNLLTTQTQEVTGTLDNRGPIPAGASGRISFTLNLKHSGTAGTPPEAAVPFRACGMAETITAAAVTGTATAGGAHSITLAAGASAVNNLYAGMPITLTGGTGSGQTRYITNYVGSTKVATVYPVWTTNPDATSLYSIPINVKYGPISSPVEYATGYLHENRADGGLSRLSKIVGSQGTWSLTQTVRGICKVQFTFQGLGVAPSDVAIPAAPVYDTSLPQPWLAALTYLGDVASRPNTINMDYGANIQLVDAPDAALGFDGAEIVQRQVAGSINPPKSLQSLINPFTLWQNQTDAPFVTVWGPSAGNKILLTVPQARIQSVTDADVRGFGHDNLPFRGVGDNAGVFICFH